MRNTVAVHHFHNADKLPFDKHQYSALKFGDDVAARQFGHDLALTFFEQHSAMLLANHCVVIPSPYNHVQNAASIMTKHFIDRLNLCLVSANGSHVEWSIVHRKVSYTNDYGFMSAEARKELIGNDQFYLNKKFISGKTLIFIDDVRITGTHEDTLVRILGDQKLSNPMYFLYYAMAGSDILPQTEAGINFAAIRDIQDFVSIVNEPNNHTIVRPIKYLLSISEDHLQIALDTINSQKLVEMYYGALGEGYYQIPSYQRNLQHLAKAVGH